MICLRNDATSCRLSDCDEGEEGRRMANLNDLLRPPPSPAPHKITYDAAAAAAATPTRHVDWPTEM